VNLSEFSRLKELDRDLKYEISGVLLNAEFPLGFCIIVDTVCDAKETLVVITDSRLEMKLNSLPVWKVGGPPLWERATIKGLFESRGGVNKQCYRIVELVLHDKGLAIAFES
jgi:hypothetical protein